MRPLLVLTLALPLAAESPFAWLAGQWQGSMGRATIEEHWLPPTGNSLLGLSRTFAADRLLAFEYLRIIEKNGETFYVAQPNGRPPTEFKLTSATPTKAVFENPTHDFPKLITYELTAPNQLTATIAAGEKKQQFRFERVQAQRNALSPAELQAGWQLLFNGHSLAGWRWSNQTPAPTPSWAVVNGELRSTPGQGTPVYLLTENSFTDFELAFSWRIEAAGNSGIKYRIQSIAEKARLEPTGLEYQLTDDLTNPDALSTPRHSSGALYDYVPPTRSRPAQPNVWHHSRILAQGLHIEHWLDGEKVIDIDLASQAAEASFALSNRQESKVTLRRQARRDSPIALQIHDGVVAFRDLKIRPLK